MEILCFQFDNTAQIFNGNFKSQTVKYEMGSSRGERAGTWIGHPFTKYKQNVDFKNGKRWWKKMLWENELYIFPIFKRDEL